MTRCTRLSAVSWLVLLVEVELFSPSCQCYKLNYVLLRTKTGWQTISQNYNLGQSPAQHITSLSLHWRSRKVKCFSKTSSDLLAEVSGTVDKERERHGLRILIVATPEAGLPLCSLGKFSREVLNCLKINVELTANTDSTSLSHLSH